MWLTKHVKTATTSFPQSQHSTPTNSSTFDGIGAGTGVRGGGFTGSTGEGGIRVTVRVGGQISDAVQYAYDPPTIQSVVSLPNSMNDSTSCFTLLVLGSSFSSHPRVTIFLSDGTSYEPVCSAVSPSHSQLSCYTVALEGTVMVEASGVSDQVAFSLPTTEVEVPMTQSLSTECNMFLSTAVSSGLVIVVFALLCLLYLLCVGLRPRVNVPLEDKDSKDAPCPSPFPSPTPVPLSVPC